MAYSWATVGTPVAFLTSERFWHGQHFVWFMTPVEGFVNALGHGPGEVDVRGRLHGRGGPDPRVLGIWLLDRMNGQPRPTASGGAGVADTAELSGSYDQQPVFSDHCCNNIPSGDLTENGKGIDSGPGACYQGENL